MPTSAGPRIIPTIHVVDDEESFRTAIERLLKAAGYDVRTYASGTEFLRAHSRTGPGCVLLDINMPGPSGLELQESLTKGGESLPIIFLSAHGDVPGSVRAMKGGAVDFLTKPISKDALFKTITIALARDVEARAVRQRLDDTRLLYKTLTPRERTVFDGVVVGKLNKQMAAELGTAERTIKAHRAQVMRKMKVDSVAALVHLALMLQNDSASESTRSSG